MLKGSPLQISRVCSLTLCPMNTGCPRPSGPRLHLGSECPVLCLVSPVPQPGLSSPGGNLAVMALTVSHLLGIAVHFCLMISVFKTSSLHFAHFGIQSRVNPDPVPPCWPETEDSRITYYRYMISSIRV